MGALGHSMRHRALALTVCVIASLPLLAGCMDSGGIGGSVSSIFAERTAAPGTTVSFPVDVTGAESNANVSLAVSDADGLQAEVQDGIDVGPNGSGGTWIEVTIPGDAETRTHEVVVTASSGQGSEEIRLRVHVEAPGTTVEEGDQVRFTFTGRYTNGTIFATDERPVANSSLPTASFYRPPRQFEPVNVSTAPSARFIEGVRLGLIGMAVGHSKTVKVSPAQGFGNETIEQEQPRVEEIDRNRTTDRVFDGQRQRFRGLVNDSSQVGDIIDVPLGSDTFPFEIVHLNDTHVEIQMNVTVGDTFTHVEAWPNSSVVTHINETTVVMRIDPPIQEGETYTHHDHWPDASRIVEITNETIRVRHSPEVGTTWTQGGPRQSQTLEVVALTDEHIVVGRDNPSPLAGLTTVFELTVLDIDKTPQGRAAP